MHKKAVFLYILLVFFLWNNYVLANPKLINKVVAVVGDKFLTLYELNILCKPYFEKFLKADLSPEEKELLKRKIQKQVLKSWIEDTLIGLEAQKYKITVTDKEVQNYIKEEIKALGEKKFKKMLQQQGLTLEDYKQKLKDKLLKIKLVQLQIREKVVITDDELKKAYENFIKSYDKSYKFWISILIIPDKNTADKIYQELKQKKSLEDFKAYSSNITLIKNEVFRAEELSPEILKNLEKLKPGDITAPIKIGQKFYIIKLLKKGYNNPPPFEKVKPELYKKLFEKKAQAYIEKWIKELQGKRYIKIFL